MSAVKQIPALRLPGRVFEQFADRAEQHLDQDSDLDLCDALSRARVKRAGRGYTVLIPMSPEQANRLAYWIRDDDPKQLRDYRDAILEQTRGMSVG